MKSGRTDVYKRQALSVAQNGNGKLGYIVFGKCPFADFRHAVGNINLGRADIFEALRLDLRHGLAFVSCGYNQLAALKRACGNGVRIAVCGKLEAQLGQNLPFGVKGDVYKRQVLYPRCPLWAFCRRGTRPRAHR